MYMISDREVVEELNFLISSSLIGSLLMILFPNQWKNIMLNAHQTELNRTFSRKDIFQLKQLTKNQQTCLCHDYEILTV